MNGWNLMPLPDLDDGYDPVPWKDDCSPLILVTEGGVQWAQGSTKRDLVRQAQAGAGTLVLPWAGRWKTNVFVVTDYERALDGLASPTGSVR